MTPTQEQNGFSPRSERLERQLQAVSRITAALHARTSLGELQQQALLVAAECTGASAGSILIHDSERALLVFEQVIGPATAALTNQSIPDHQGVAGLVFHSGEGRVTRADTHSILTVPLKTPRGQAIGVLQLLGESPGEFDADDLAVLDTIANLAASAIETARVMVRLQEEARLAAVAHRIGDITHDIKNMITPAVTGTQTLELMLQAMFGDLDRVFGDGSVPEEVAVQVREACSGVREWYPEAVQMTYDSTAAAQEYAREISNAIKGIVAAPHFEMTNAHEVAELVAKTVRASAERAGIRIDLSGLGSVPPAELDRKRMYNALYNLINNAISETPHGGTVSLSARTAIDETGQERLELVVSDTGRGMPEHVRESLFSDRTVSTKPGGTGLGTRIVKNAVDAHGGTISVESQENVGTTFRLRLPLRQKGSVAGEEQARQQHELVIRRAVEVQERREAEREQQARLQQELAIGRRIQMSLLPPSRLRLEGFEILSRSEPAAEVGGDFYNHFQVKGNGDEPIGHASPPPPRLGIVLGDVAGKGVGAALFMAVTTTVIQAQAQLLPSPAATLAATNAELHPKMHPPGGQPLFATAVYGLLDPQQSEIRFSNAGQTPPIYWPVGGEPCYLRVKGLPLGAMARASYREMVLHLAPGDRLLFCSDGFIEERNTAGEVRGYAGFLRQLQQFGDRRGPELIAALFEDEQTQVARWDETLARDDRTVVLITATTPG